MKKISSIILVFLLLMFTVFSCDITKDKEPKVTKIIVQPNPTSIVRGGYQQFTADVIGNNNPHQDVTWQVTGSYNANISYNGLLHISNDEVATDIIVTARLQKNPHIEGSATVNILQPIIDSVVVIPNPVNIRIGQSQDFTALVYGVNNQPQTVTWSISGNNSLSTLINPRGYLSVASAETANKIIVSATSTIDTGKIGTATVTILQPEYISFGGLVWRILEQDALNNRALIISKNVIETRVYHTSQTSITWENCSLRAYLNNDFYNSFTEIDRARIQPTIVQNPNNPQYNTPGGSPTNDKIFLLSIAEAQTYFTSDDDRVATFYGTEWYWWWLRSPGRNTYDAADVGHNGGVNVGGAPVDLYDYYYSGGIRPALWLNL